MGMIPYPGKVPEAATDTPAKRYYSQFDPNSAAYDFAKACMESHPDRLETYLKSSAVWPNVEGRDGITPLMAMILWRDDEYKLLACKALAGHPLIDINMQTLTGSTALDMAEESGFTDVADMLRSRRGIENRKGPVMLPSSAPAKVEQKEELPKKQHSEWGLKKKFCKACDNGDVTELLRFKDAHELISQDEKDKLLARCLQPDRRLPNGRRAKSEEVGAVLMMYGANAFVPFKEKYSRNTAFWDIEYRGLMDMLIMTHDHIGKKQMLKNVMVDPHREWRLSQYQRAKNEEMIKLRAKAASTGDSGLKKMFAQAVAENDVHKTMAVYAAMRQERKKLFGKKYKIALDEKDLKRAFAVAVGDRHYEFGMLLAFDGLQDFDVPFIMKDTFGGYTSLINTFKSGKYTPQPYKKTVDGNWSLDG